MKQRFLFLLAHPDDLEIWTGGTVLNHLKNKDTICAQYLFCNDDKRLIELKKNADRLGIDIVITKEEIDTDSIVEFNPTIIITHWQFDSHPEHLIVYNLFLNLIPRLVLNYKINFKAFSCDCYNSLGNNINHIFIPTDYIDITNVWKAKLNYIRNFKSQPVSYWINMITNQNKIHGSRTGVKFAEGFVQIPILGVIKKSKLLLK